MNYKELLKEDSYKFLFTNPHLGNNIILLGLGGSHAYGTNVETSDIDIRGIVAEQPNELIGFHTVEQYIDEPTDTVIYAFNKMIKLLMQNNPNTVEILGLDSDQYIYMSSLGKELLDHRSLFISQRSYYTFGGYAKAQLKRLENALARDNYPEDRKNEHICIALENSIAAFNKQHTDELNPAFAYVDENGKLRYKLDMDISANDMESFYAMVSNTTRAYKELLHRNRKKDDAHLCKHAMHLLRLEFMCLDILTKHEIITHRVAERDLLMSIRNGEYMDENGLFVPEFYALVKEVEDKCTEALQTTQLQKTPDINVIESWVMDVNRRIIDGEFREEFKI